MADADYIEVEVAYALPTEQVILKVDVAPGASVENAIEESGILDRFHDIDLKVNKVGKFGKLCKLKETLRAGDRVEIYRPLIADPKEVRRQRAAQGKVMKRGAAAANESAEETGES